jgi:hypothetical protein
MKKQHIPTALGGLSAGMVAMEGTGAISQVSVHHKPDIHNEPQAFAALCVEVARTARVQRLRWAVNSVTLCLQRRGLDGYRIPTRLAFDHDRTNRIRV